MKKIILYLFMAAFSFSSVNIFAVNADKKSEPVVPATKENKLTEEELSRIVTRVEEIRKIDRSKLTDKEKKEIRKELKEMKKAAREPGGYIYIGATTLLLIIILVILFA